MSITIYTAQMRIETDDAIDITIKSAKTDLGRYLSPTWDMVNGIKSGTLTEDQYTEQYLALMRQRYSRDSEFFHRVLREENSITLKCFCPANTFCHRRIAVFVLMKIADHIGIPATDGGEIVHSRRRC